MAEHPGQHRKLARHHAELAKHHAGIAAHHEGMASKSKGFHPGGEKGKLHRELGISTDKKIPSNRLAAAARSKNPEVKRDAIRAQTMKKWRHV